MIERAVQPARDSGYIVRFLLALGALTAGTATKEAARPDDARLELVAVESGAERPLGLIVYWSVASPT